MFKLQKLHPLNIHRANVVLFPTEAVHKNLNIISVNSDIYILEKTGTITLVRWEPQAE